MRLPSRARSARAAFLLLAGCGGERVPASDPPRLVVLYATCTLNEGFLGPYVNGGVRGGTRAGIEGLTEIRFTPNLDRLAREGIVFERHQTESAQSGIAFASIFTGTQADVHGIYYHP